MRRVAPLSTALLLACSTLAQKTEPEACTNDAECPEDTLCLYGLCLPSNGVPPHRYVGFNLEEGLQGGGYRLEVAGCDKEVELNLQTGFRALAVAREQMTYELSLQVFKTTDFDPENPTVDDLLAANFRLSQDSRFAREAIAQTATHPTVEGDNDIVRTVIRWPRYHPLQPRPMLPKRLGPRGHILWRIEPLEPVGERTEVAAPMYVNLTPLVPEGFPDCGDAPASECTEARRCTVDAECCPADGSTCEPEVIQDACLLPGTWLDGIDEAVCRRPGTQVLQYNKQYDIACDRAVEATIVRATPDLLPGEPVAIESVTLRYADREGEPRLGAPVLGDWWPSDARECQRDDQCVPGTQFCNRATNRCEVALAGLDAASGSATDMLGPTGANFRTRVFTYCTPGVEARRAFTVRIDPAPDTGLLGTSYAVEADFIPPQSGNEGSAADLGNFCLIDLAPLYPVEVVPSGKPAQLLQSTAGDYKCCDLDCLPNGGTSMPPSAPSRCTVAGASITASTPIAADIDAWSEPDSQCVPPIVDNNGNVGVVTRTANCPTTGNGPCLLQSMPLERAQQYTIRVVSPTGSVLQSIDQTFDIVPDPQSADPIRIEVELPQRPIVRGRVTLPSSLCDPNEEDDGDCGSEGAVVLAERLRRTGQTTANTPGPYFHQVATFHDPDVGDGAYVLPLDPGVWIMTALPDPGTAGGPAPYKLVDVPPEGEFDQPFVLEPGILVTIDLASFDRRSLVLPLDIGSWELQRLLHPDRDGEIDEADRLLNLMAPGECLTADPTRGCSIRRLVAGTGLSPTQVGHVRFTARDVGDEPEQRDCRPP